MAGRIDRDTMFMEMAILVSERGTCPRAAVGAVIVRDGRPLSIGYNGSPPGMDHCEDVGCEPEDGCLRTIHAESNAIAWAARNGVSLSGATMYCTHSPCLDCAKLMLSAGIVAVHFKFAYRLGRPDFLEEGGVAVVAHF